MVFIFLDTYIKKKNNSTENFQTQQSLEKRFLSHNENGNIDYKSCGGKYLICVDDYREERRKTFCKTDRQTDGRTDIFNHQCAKLGTCQTK